MEELELVGVKVTENWDDRILLVDATKGLQVTVWDVACPEEAGKIVLDAPSVRRLVEYAQAWLEGK